METRFSYKEWLSMYDLDIKLFENYDFIVEDSIPLRKVFILVTDKGNKIIKRVAYNDEDLDFIQRNIEYLRNNEFSRIIKFYLNKQGKIITPWKNNNYIVMDLIEGRECDYINPLDIKLAVKGLAQMHNASKNIDFDVDSNRFMGFKLIKSFEEKYNDLIRIKNEFSSYENKNEFHNIFLNNVDHHIERIKLAINVLKNSKYDELCRSRGNFILCHHDLAYHNILIYNEEGYFIDFDYSIIDLRVHDLCNLINKVTKHSCFDSEVLKLIIDEYNSYTSPLTKEEYEVLYGMLCFPQGFYSIASDYFYRKKLWKYDSFLYKISKKVQDINEQEEMIDNFKKTYVDATF